MSMDIQKLNQRNLKKIPMNELLKYLQSPYLSKEFKDLCEAEWQRRSGVRQVFQKLL